MPVSSIFSFSCGVIFIKPFNQFATLLGVIGFETATGIAFRLGHGRALSETPDPPPAEGFDFDSNPDGGDEHGPNAPLPSERKVRIMTRQTGPARDLPPRPCDGRPPDGLRQSAPGPALRCGNARSRRGSGYGSGTRPEDSGGWGHRPAKRCAVCAGSSPGWECRIGGRGCRGAGAGQEIRNAIARHPSEKIGPAPFNALWCAAHARSGATGIPLRPVSS